METSQANLPIEITEACRRFRDRALFTSYRLNPEAGCYESAGPSRTYGELHEDLGRLLAGLTGLGVSRGDRLAVLLENSPEMVLTEWACLYAGTLWVALNTRSSPLEIEAILRDSAPALLVVGVGQLPLLDGVELPPGCRVVVVPEPEMATVGQGGTGREQGPADGVMPESSLSWHDLLAPNSAVAANSAVPANFAVPAIHAIADFPAPTDPVRIRYTSGTAGHPKGAMISADGYAASVETVSSVLGEIRVDDVLIQAAPMTHASGAMLLPHVMAGASAVLLDRFDAAALIDLVARTRGTAMFLVPTMLVRVLEALAARGPEDSSLSTMRTIVYGGAAMPVDRLEAGLRRLGRVFTGIYGLTESTWPVTALLREDHPLPPEHGEEAGRNVFEGRLCSCGRPTAVGEVRIQPVAGSEEPAACPTPVDPSTQEGMPIGEILVRGRNTMLGYWQSPDPSSREVETPDRKGLDADGWMHTGDLGFLDADGFLTIVDRLHDMIVSGGFNVYPREVEDALSSHLAVLECAVVGRPSAEWGETVHAAVVLRPGSSATEKELADWVGERTAGFRKPRSVEFVRELPRNSSGKILRREVRKRLIEAGG